MKSTLARGKAQTQGSFPFAVITRARSLPACSRPRPEAKSGAGLYRSPPFLQL
jgi:hypothetical protein